MPNSQELVDFSEFDKKYFAPKLDNPKRNSIVTALGDTALSFGQGVVDLGQAEVGLANLATGGLAGKALKKVGYDSAAEQQFVNQLHSPEFLRSQQAVNEAGNIDGTQWEKARNTIGATLDNPRSLLTGVVPESIPMMLPGIKAGQMILQGAKGAGAAAERAAISKAILAGSASEGAVTAGQIADQAEQADRNYTDYALPAAKAGLTTAAISALSGRVLGDASTSVSARLAGVEGNQFAGGLPARFAKGAVTEGIVEEAPQSANEQYQTNVAMGNPDPMQGVGAQAATGALAGGVTGGFMAGLQGNQPNNQPAQPEPLSLPAPNAQLPYDRTSRPLGNADRRGNPDEIVFPDGSTSSINDYYDLLRNKGLNHDEATTEVYSNILASQPNPYIPESELANIHAKNQQQAQQLLSKYGADYIDKYSEQFPRDFIEKTVNDWAVNQPNKLIGMINQFVSTENLNPDKPNYHPGIQTLANELANKGDIAYINDSNGNIIGRTKSINPDWFKNGRFLAVDENNQPLKRTASVREIQTAVDKHYADKKTTRFEQGILRSLDSIARTKEQDIKAEAQRQSEQVYPTEPAQIIQTAPAQPEPIPNSPLSRAVAASGLTTQQPSQPVLINPINQVNPDNRVQEPVQSTGQQEPQPNNAEKNTENQNLTPSNPVELNTPDGYDNLDNLTAITNQREVMRSLGFTEQEIEEELNGTNQRASIEGSKNSQSEELLTSYTAAEIADRAAKQAATAKHQAEQKRKADLEVSTLADEMIGNIGTVDAFSPSKNTAQTDKPESKLASLDTNKPAQTEEKNNRINQAEKIDTIGIPLDTPENALNYIAKNATTPLLKLLAQKLQDKLPADITINSVQDLPSKNYPDKQAKGRYNRDTHVLTLNLSVLKTTQDLEQTLLHELIHAVTLNNISTNATASRELKRISKLLEKHLAANKITDTHLKGVAGESIRSIEELVTYGLTDSKLQALLKEIKDGERTLWNKFVVAIARAIGFDSINSKQKTALESLLQVSDELINESSSNESSNNTEFESVNFGDIKDFFTDEPAQTHSLADIYTQLNSGKPLKNPIGKQYYFDKLVTNFSDLSRPFDRFMLDTFTFEQASPVIDDKDRAQGMKQAYEKQAVDKFKRPLADAVRAIVKQTGMANKTAKDMTGYWMSAVYAPEANAFLMQKDQRAVDDLEQEKQDVITTYSAINAPTALDTQQYNDEIIRLDKAITKAKDNQQARRTAINNPAIIDPTQQPLDAGLAGGFNNATAAQLVKDIEAKIPRALLKAAAKPVYDMLAWKLKNDIKDGKVSQATVNTWLNSPNYVPLTGDPSTDDSVEDNFITGGINQQKDHALQGRTTSIAKNGIDAAFEQVEKSARYHGWNDFKNEIHALYNSIHADLVANGLSSKQASDKLWQDYQLKRRPADTQIPAGENDIIYRKDNKGYIYTFNNQAAMEALRSMNDEKVPSSLKPIQYLTGLQARLVTIGMIGFAPANTIRDILEKSENIRVQQLPGVDMDKVGDKVGRDTLKYGLQLLKRLKMIAAVLAEDTPLSKINLLGLNLKFDPTDADVIKLKEYLSLGGSSTYGEMLSKDSKKLAEKLNQLGTLKNKAWDAILLYNQAFETISGFAVYKALLDQGVEPKKAAVESLNLMNFRKRGRLTSPLRALYMFVNPTIQGAHQLTNLLSTSRGRMRFTAYTVAAAVIYTILRSIDADDDELGFNRMDEQSNFQLYRNIHIPTGDGEYLKIPVGFGMQQLAWAYGVNLIRTAVGTMTLKELIAEDLWAGAKAVFPVAPSETSIAKNPMVWMAQTFTPQIAKPLTNIALDVTPFGSPLTNARYEKQDIAQALQGRKQTSQEYKKFAIALTQATDGYIDMYPEQIKALVNGYAIGHLNDIVKILIENPNAESLGRHVISPFLDRWLVANNDEKIKERLYYELRNKMNDASVKRSTGSELNADEMVLANLGDKVKKLELHARGKSAAATRAEKAGQTDKANNLRKQAERIKKRYMDFSLNILR